MRAVFLLLSLVLTAALLAGCESPLGGARMAYVDVAVILEKSRAAEEAEAHLKKVREVLQANCQTKVDTKNTPSSFIFSTVVL